MGIFRIYQTAFYKGEEVTIHGYNGLTEIYSVKNKKGEIFRGIREFEITLAPRTNTDKK
jgi:hypothetical protein